MKKFLLSLLLIGLVCMSGYGENVEAYVGEPFYLRSTFKNPKIKWRIHNIDNKALFIIKQEELKDQASFIAVPRTVGKALIEAWSVEGDEPVVEVFTINFNPSVNPIPPPNPPVPPIPTPPGPDPIPTPTPTDLVAKIKVAYGQDVAEGRGEAKHLTGLGKVFYDNGLMLEQITDPAVAPKTVANFYEKLVFSSRHAYSDGTGIPPPPYLGKTRQVIASQLSGFEPMTVITDSVRTDLSNKSKTVGKALIEAAK